MSDGKHDVAVQPLVIVRRRRGGGEEAHHGGVWKIAYADFMTAMMAFFLVMWLVNAADKKTIVQVAAYFNPVRLTDKTPSSPGLENPTSTDAKSQLKRAADSKDKDAQKAAPKSPLDLTGAGAAIGLKEKAEKPESELSKSFGQAHKDEALFSDPMGVLDKLASKVALPPATAAKLDNPKSVLRDPFDPGQRGMPSVPRPLNAKPEQSVAEGVADTKGENLPNSEPIAPDATAKNAKEAEQRDAAKALEAEIKRSFAMIGVNVPNAEVKATPEGILISLTDKAEFGMFAVGSAEPRPELVVAIGKLAELLKARTGALVIRGHTDARQYRNGSYDNWRLSSARAQMSYHMLVRGGVDAGRIMAIEGRADRDFKAPNDTESALNRRIDVLIKAPQS